MSVLFEGPQISDELLKIKNSIEVGGIGQTSTTKAYITEKLNFKAQEVGIEGLSFLYIKLQDNPFFSTPEAVYIDGIIGYDLLRKIITKVDFDKAELTFYQNQPTINSSFSRVPLSFKGNVPFIDLNIVGSRGDAVKINALFDTGLVGALMLNDKALLKENFDSIYQSRAIGVGGTEKIDVIQVEGVTVGNFTLNKIFASLTDPKADNSGHSILGNAMISRFNIILDYQKKQLMMEKNPYYSAPFILNRSGLSSLPHAESAAVIAIREDSPTDHHGIEKGDIIISVNNIDVNEENFDSLLDQLNDLNTSEKLCVLKLKTTRCFTLKMKHFKQGTLNEVL